ncbi:MAG: outer membrane beta-barrel protein [Bacteroidales bacterium]|nr:outer membrane beta-barrel protein [Bacteroidales bacterium]
MLRTKLIYLLLIVSPVMGQDYSWDVINSENSGLPNQTIKSISFDEKGTMWVGTYMGGIACFENEKWTVYNTSNSELPHNYVNSIAIGKNDVKWIGTDGGGLARFDGTSWEVYKTSNSGIPSNVVMSMFCDDDGSVWVGTYFGGLAHLNSGIWTIYNDENSPLLSNKVVCITKDKKGLLWLGTQGGGVASFDGKNWNVYTERNSKLPNDYIYSIAVDEENKKWIGTGGGGIAVFNDVFWIKYNSSNTGLTDDNIRPIRIDEKNNKWIGTYIGGINVFDGKNWTVYDFQNSSLPDDEVTTMAWHDNQLFVGTERSGIISVTDNKPIVTQQPVAIAETTSEEIPSEQQPEVGSGETETALTPEGLEIAAVTTTQEKQSDEVSKTPETTKIPAVVTLKPTHRIILMMDAADVYFERKKLTQSLKAYKFMLNNKEKIDGTYEVKLLIYSTNYDINPRKIIFTPKELEMISVKASNIIYIEGESTFTEGLQKAYNTITEDYNAEGNNSVIAVTHKFIRDDETAKVVAKNNLDEFYVRFSLIAFKSDTWKLEHKMKRIIPKGGGRYYSLSMPTWKDNWYFTGQFGLSLFRGDVDVNKVLVFPGVYGVSAEKKVISTGMIDGHGRFQINFGKMKGEKNQQNFENKFKEFNLNFKVYLKKWPNHNFRFEKFKPYGFLGLGLINYRVLLRNDEGDVVNGFGYDVISEDIEANGPSPAKSKAVTEFMIPMGIGVSYTLNDQINLEAELTSRYISSDQLDGKIRFKDDKYWFITVGVTYKLNTKRFMADVLK